MSNGFQQITELRPRLDIFLSRLKERAEEITAEAKTVIPEPNGNDPEEYNRAFLAFEAALRKQMQDIIERGQNIFLERFEIFTHSPDPRVRAAYQDAENAVAELAQDVHALTEEVFAPTTQNEAEQHFNAALKDWSHAAATFHCKGCGELVPIQQLYYSAMYLRCASCGVETLFTPTSAMQTAPQWAEVLADNRTANLKAEVDRIAKTPNKWAGQLIVSRIKYVLTRHRHLIELMPNYAPTQVDSLRRAVFMEAHSKKHCRIEPAGLRDTDVTYYNVMGSLGDTLKDFRAQNDVVFAEIVAGIVRDLARPGCEVAAAVLDDSFTHKLWAKYSRIAQQQPEF